MENQAQTYSWAGVVTGLVSYGLVTALVFFHYFL
jgi:hypothetical protein